MELPFKSVWQAMKKDSSTTHEILTSLQLLPDQSIPHPRSYDDYVKLYENVLWVYACIWSIASHASMVPYKIVTITNGLKGPDKKVVPYDHPAYKLFRNPNPEDTFEDMIESTMTFMELNGDAYWELVYGKDSDPDSKTPPIELYSLRPDRVRIIPRKDGKGIHHYTYKVKRWKKGVDFNPSEMIHYKYFAPNNDFYGQGTMTAAAKTILLEQYANQFQESTLVHNAVPQGVIETDYDVDDDEMKRIKSKWRQTYEGVKKAGEIAVLPLGLSFKPLSYHPRDLEWKNLLTNNRERLFAVFGVNNAILGILQNMTHDNYRMQIRSFFMNTMKPKMQKISSRITKKILQPYYGEDYVFEFDFSQFLQEDEAQLSSRLQKEIQYGIINPNEAREILLRARYDGGDTFFIASNLQAISSEDKSLIDQLTNDEPKPDTEEDLPDDLDDLEDEEDEIDDTEKARRAEQDRQSDIARGRIEGEPILPENI